MLHTDTLNDFFVLAVVDKHYFISSANRAGSCRIIMKILHGVEGNIQFYCPEEWNIPRGAAEGNIAFQGAIKLYIPRNRHAIFSLLYVYWKLLILFLFIFNLIILIKFQTWRHSGNNSFLFPSDVTSLGQ